ncbi:MAG: phosphate propanoyltransferase [Bacilli bacterium]|nr:phosphate propanoyltransferase [Bacilli bacterium]
MKVQIGISNRHVHLTDEHLKKLFGKNYKLENVKDLNQPGQFVSNSKVMIKTLKGEINDVRVVGPTRDYTQVEISRTDAIKLGLNPPVRKSGDLIGSSPITLIGPRGIVDLEYGCIIADRHIHITPKQKEVYGLSNYDKVTVVLQGEKGGTIGNVSLKVSEESYFELHLDTDDANAHLVRNGDLAIIIEGEDL